ncbi:MAG: glycosyltransferase family 2 protein [Muribaculaceae bacterium]
MGLTIFTPTYNRAYILPSLYESLCAQSTKKFIWLIVDDGSTDNTETLINKWIKENIISITYIRQNNGGKMRAHNRGVLEAKTELFLCVDSDDHLNDINDVQCILNKWNEVNNNINIAGIIAYKLINNIIEYTFPKDIKLTPLNKLYQKGFIGDTTLVYRTDILKNHLFPEIDGEKFITEAYIYDQIDQKYIMSLFHRAIIKCAYLNDGYSKNAIKLKKDNPIGWFLYYNQRTLYSNTFINKIKNMSYAIAYSLLSRNLRLMFQCKPKLLIIPCLLLGVILRTKLKKGY